ncbi:MAG: isoleucine--tRNA ligase [Patescibacteria group bacterium]|jgi:isoleucyl-tRNA synthetase|nr:isoleucine--tRNA ligase [Patescibacteria group bacterium]
MSKHFLAEIEEQVIQKWDEEQTFLESLKQNKNKPLFSFYDGPPFANGIPHYGHLVQTTIKDTITRYKTMAGYYVPRRVGWDTHGLPVEYAIEKEHDFRGKQDIIDYGIDKFNKECRESVFKYKSIWEDMFKRVGRWADYSKTYTTLDESYIESVWWVFKELFKKGLIYKDFRSSPYCPRCATPLSNFELNQGYQDGIEDPSLYIKFKLKDENAYLLGWTTTPWSLPGNGAIAVNPEASYVYVKLEDDNKRKEVLILARNRLEALSSDNYHILKEIKGSELIGKEYFPLFRLDILDSYPNKANLYKVWGADFVSIEDGSGVLHVAPAFGEDDLILGKQKDIPVLLTIDEFGKVKENIGLDKSIEGLFFKKADQKIIELLTKKDLVYAAQIFKHTYPFCWRCDTPLLYYATDSWMINVTKVKEQLILNNQKINWIPEHIRDGRFGKWLENVKDWAISRNRFWGAPIPIWITEDGEIEVIGSIEELREKAINGQNISDLHRPYIDQIKIKTISGKIASRIDEVFDCWFESGSMPYAQNHYPFEDNNWSDQFPAQFIAEAIDQTRGWFYTLHVLATALFDKPAFLNVICSGWVTAADGEKLSKRKKNYAPMDQLFDLFGVDSLRFFLISSPIVNGEDIRFKTESLRDIQRKVFMSLNNVYTFYKMYADLDKFVPDQELTEPISDNLLDQWIISRVNQTIAEVQKNLDNYKLDKASKPIVDLIDDSSNWFVRRSRRRFWKSENNLDKQKAYQTLYFVIIRICQLIAPFSPFLSDYIYSNITKGTNNPRSVHLSSWPSVGKINEELLDEMKNIREAINEGLMLRARAGIKVRQPLASFSLPKIKNDFKEIIADELNVKKVNFDKSIKLDTKLTATLKNEGIVRDLIRYIQNGRKKAGKEVSDRINLNLIIDKDNNLLLNAINEFRSLIEQETLSKVELNGKSGAEYKEEIKIEGYTLEINITKS